MLRKSKSFSLHDSINANHRQISPTGTDHYTSKPYKVILFEKKLFISGIFWTFKSKFQIIHAAIYITCFFLTTLITVFFICSIILQYRSPLFFHFFCFYFTFFYLFCSSRDTFYDLATMFNSISLQPAFDCSISLQYIIQKTFTKLQTTFQNEERNYEKELL